VTKKKKVLRGVVKKCEGKNILRAVRKVFNHGYFWGKTVCHKERFQTWCFIFSHSEKGGVQTTKKSKKGP